MACMKRALQLRLKLQSNPSFRKIEQHHCQVGDCLHNMGIIFLLSGRYQKAINILNEAKTTRANSNQSEKSMAQANTSELLGMVYAEIGRPDKSIEILNSVIQSYRVLGRGIKSKFMERVHGSIQEIKERYNLQEKPYNKSSMSELQESYNGKMPKNEGDLILSRLASHIQMLSNESSDYTNMPPDQNIILSSLKSPLRPKKKRKKDNNTFKHSFTSKNTMNGPTMFKPKDFIEQGNTTFQAEIDNPSPQFPSQIDGTFDLSTFNKINLQRASSNDSENENSPVGEGIIRKSVVVSKGEESQEDNLNESPLQLRGRRNNLLGKNCNHPQVNSLYMDSPNRIKEFIPSNSRTSIQKSGEMNSNLTSDLQDSNQSNLKASQRTKKRTSIFPNVPSFQDFSNTKNRTSFMDKKGKRNSRVTNPVSINYMDSTDKSLGSNISKSNDLISKTLQVKSYTDFGEDGFQNAERKSLNFQDNSFANMDDNLIKDDNSFSNTNTDDNTLNFGNKSIFQFDSKRARDLEQKKESAKIIKDLRLNLVQQEEFERLEEEVFNQRVLSDSFNVESFLEGHSFYKGLSKDRRGLVKDKLGILLPDEKWDEEQSEDSMEDVFNEGIY